MLKNGIFPNGTAVPKTKEEMQWALDNDYIIPDFKDGKWSVEKLLDNADVKLEWFVPSATAFEFFNFIRLTLGEEPENVNPPAHYFLLDAIFGEDTVEPYYRVRNIPYKTLKDRVAVMAHREFSKALTLDTLIATPNGYKKNKDIKVGDYVISRTGKPTRVIAKSKIFNDPVYRLIFEDGRTIECCEDHQHILIDSKNNEFVCDTKFIANNIDKEQYSIPSLPIGSYIKLKSIEKIDTVPTQCISVECPTKSFVLGNGLITHNSTLIGSFLPLFIAHKGSLPGFGRIGYMLYVADSIENNVKTTMQTIGSVYKESLFLNERFEASHLTNESVKFIRKPSTDYEIKLYNKYKKLGYKDENIPGRMKRTFVMDGFGVLSGVRGTREGLDRPKGAIFDDLIRSEKDAQSNAILEKANSTIDADVLKGLNQNGNFAILIGTPYNKKDPVYKRIDGGSWLPIVFPKADKIKPDLTKEEFRGSWEDRHTYEKQMKELRLALIDKKNGDPKPYRRLMQEFYLRIVDEEDKVVDMSWFETDIDRKDILAHSQNYRFYMTTDFTTTGKRGSDYSAMMLWALDHNGTFYLIDLFVKKVELEEQYNKVIDIVRNVKPYTSNVEVGVETDGQQKAHIFALKKMMIETGITFTFARQKGSPVGSEGISSRSVGGNKHWRFMLALPMLQTKKIKFTNYIKTLGYRSQDGEFIKYFDELEEELSLVTSTSFNSTNDDALDCISMLPQMETYSVPVDNEDNEDEPKRSIKDINIYARIQAKEDEDSSAYTPYV